MDYTTLQDIAPTNMKIVAQNGGKFHILTNDGATIRSVLANSTTIDDNDELAGTVAIQDFRNHLPSIRLQKFRQRYISQTLNAATYEEMCMWRWIMMADYFQGLLDDVAKKVDRILAIDTDVLLTADPRRLLDTVQFHNNKVDELESIMIVNGAAMLWTTKGLENFVTFLSHVYETKENATAFIKQHGEVLPSCKPESSLLIPCVPEEKQMWHLSDMHILNGWFQENAYVTTTRLYRGQRDEEQCLAVQPVWSSKKLAASLEGFHFQKQRSRIKSILKDGNATDVCLVHFQGDTKQIVPGFVSFVMGESNQSSFSTR